MAEDSGSAGLFFWHMEPGYTSTKDRRASRVIFEETKIKGGHG